MAQVFPKLLPGEPAWGGGEEANLREYLMTPMGQRFLQKLIFLRPDVTERRDRAVRNIQSDTRAGYEECLAQIFQLADSPPLTAADRASQSRS